MLKSIANILKILALMTSIQSAHCLHFIPSTDPRLGTCAQEVSIDEILTDKIQTLITEMLTLSGYEADPAKFQKSGVLVGLAAPQVGEMKQIIIINTLSDQELRAGKLPRFDVLINPKIIWQSKEKAPSREGCFSVPEKFLGLPLRPTAVVVEAYNREGEKIRKRYEDQVAFVVHHEVDHLLGIRFPERLQSEEELHILDQAQDLPRYRKEWRNWKQHASYELWQQMRAKDYSEAESQLK